VVVLVQTRRQLLEQQDFKSIAMLTS